MGGLRESLGTFPQREKKRYFKRTNSFYLNKYTLHRRSVDIHCGCCNQKMIVNWMESETCKYLVCESIQIVFQMQARLSREIINFHFFKGLGVWLHVTKTFISLSGSLNTTTFQLFSMDFTITNSSCLKYEMAFATRLSKHS